MTAKRTGPSSTFESESGDEPERTGRQRKIFAEASGPKSHAQRSGFSFPTLFGSLASYAGFMALVLAQLGYTMVLATESTFGIARDSLLEDWAHTVRLGAPFLLTIVSGALENLLNLQFYRKVLQVHGWMFVALLVLVLVWLRYRAPARRTFLSVEARRMWFGAGIVSLGTIGVIPTVCAVAVILGLPTVGIPMFGRAAAKEILHDYVIKPDHCLPVQNLAERRLAYDAVMSGSELKGSAAVCVAVRKAGKETLFGRVVLSGSKYIVLFDPNTGVTRKVDTEGAVIEAVTELGGTH
jgi:hypothetical protein